MAESRAEQSTERERERERERKREREREREAIVGNNTTATFSNKQGHHMEWGVMRAAIPFGVLRRVGVVAES